MKRIVLFLMFISFLVCVHSQERNELSSVNMTLFFEALQDGNEQEMMSRLQKELEINVTMAMRIHGCLICTTTMMKAVEPLVLQKKL